jgi:hypothetical protein
VLGDLWNFVNGETLSQVAGLLERETARLV